MKTHQGCAEDIQNEQARIRLRQALKPAHFIKIVNWMGIVENEVSSHDFCTSRNPKRVFESAFSLKWIPVLFTLNRKDDNLH